MSRLINGKTYHTTSEACRLAGISRSTLLRWVNKGIVSEVSRRDRRGWRLFTEDDINSIKAEAGKINLHNEL